MKANKKLAVQMIAVFVILASVIAIVIYKKSSSPTTNLTSATTDYDVLWDASWDLDDLRKQGKPVLVDFTAEWCIPCRTFNPILEKTKESLGDRVIMKIVDVDKNRDVSSQYPVMVIPTQILFNADGSPYTPSDSINIFGFKSYSKEENNDDSITIHEGAMSENQLLELLGEMGIDESGD